MAVISFLYLAYTIIYVLIHRKKIHPKDFITLAFFPIPPIIGGIIQTAFYGVSLIWVAATVSLLTIFINFQNDQLNTDFLTGLYNRRQLEDYLQIKCQNTKSKVIAGLMLDLDFFKEINDTYGHNSGDEALKYVADILKQTFRKNDFIARFGGDEFVVILEINVKAELEKAVSRLMKTLQSSIRRKLCHTNWAQHWFWIVFCLMKKILWIL